MKNILLISVPGAGKGVVSNYLIDKYNFTHLSAGDLIRDEIKNNPDLAEIVSQGKLIDDSIINGLIDKFVSKNSDKNLIFDGFPRTMSQVPAFEEILKKNNISIDKLVHINIDKEVAIKRITGRVMCEDCNHIFNKYIDNLTDTCPDCSGKLYSRSDDNLETYNNRYDLYINETYPVFEHYKDILSTFEIENNAGINEVYDQVDRMMKEEI
ncbi:MAG: nucleoside monophosphate kinase [Bacilli bacterium]|nr:nucleoside monophosphate kinase [Bacilli bacterium]